jgi:hypothetical protein
VGVTYSAAAGAGALVITGYAPTVSVTSNTTVTPDAGTLAITGYAPTVTKTDRVSVVPSAGALVITGYAPTVTATESSPTVNVGFSGLVITGYPPTVTYSGARKEQPAGGRPSRKRRKYQVEIDGQAFSVDSPAEAQQLLEQAEELARQQAEQAAERAANAPKRAKRKIIADARKVLKTPDVRMIADDEEDAELLEAAAQEFIARINELYADTMRAIEIGALLRVQIDNDEDDAIVALLMAA